MMSFSPEEEKSALFYYQTIDGGGVLNTIQDHFLDIYIPVEYSESLLLSVG